MGERIARLNGTTRAEKQDCDDEQVFHDWLLVVVTQKDCGSMPYGTAPNHGANAYRADFKPICRVFNRNGHEIEPQPAQRKIVLPPWENR
jgi:hypothetical protein